MALQSSGQISFSNIATELGASTPYSLRSMSSEAGFSTPDSISEFYGYSGGGGGLTQFYRSSDYPGPYDSCYRDCEFSVWHNGALPTPGIGDTVYTDSGGTSTLSAGYYGYSDTYFAQATTTLEVNKSGVVLEIWFC